jgi:hypothetical protein
MALLTLAMAFSCPASNAVVVKSGKARALHSKIRIPFKGVLPPLTYDCNTRHHIYLSVGHSTDVMKPAIPHKCPGIIVHKWRKGFWSLLEYYNKV